MNQSFKANAAQHKAFIATVKSQFPAINVTGLSLELHCSDYKYNWAINDVITFFTATGKYFVVRASDLLVSVDEANNATEPYPVSREEILAELKSAEIYQLQEETGQSLLVVNNLLDKAPARNSIGSLTKEHSYIPPTGYHSAYSSEENQYVHWEKDDSSDDACDTSLDDDSHLLYADKTVLVSADDTEESFKADWLTNKQHEDALQAAKILFHYWALSGNGLPLSNYWVSLKALFESIGAKTDFYIYSCPAREESIGSTALVIDDKRFFLWENTVVSQNLFFQTLKNQAVNYGVHSWFTQKDISVYQQNYQSIVADCEAIIALHEQAYKNADNGIGEYIAFPANINDLHSLVEYLNGTEAADEVVNSIKDEQFLFFQVLSTMNFINSTASIVEA